MASFNSRDNQVSLTSNGYAFFNGQSMIDKTTLQFSMWKTTIKVSIFPLIESTEGNSDDQRYDYKSGISIYLPPNKAYAFANILRKFKEDPKTYSSYGVYAGTSLITVEDPELTLNRSDANPIIMIRKFAKDESGALEASYAYEFRSDNCPVITNYNQETRAFNRDVEMYKLIELDIMITQLEEYAKAMTGAYAFANMELMYPCLDKIAMKLGVEIYPRAYKTNSYFSNPPQNGTVYGQQQTYDTRNLDIGSYGNIDDTMIS